MRNLIFILLSVLALNSCDTFKKLQVIHDTKKVEKIHYRNEAVVLSLFHKYFPADTSNNLHEGVIKIVRDTITDSAKVKALIRLADSLYQDNLFMNELVNNAPNFDSTQKVITDLHNRLVKALNKDCGTVTNTTKERTDTLIYVPPTVKLEIANLVSQNYDKDIKITQITTSDKIHTKWMYIFGGTALLLFIAFCIFLYIKIFK